MTNSSIPSRERVQATLCYLGLFPLGCLFPRLRRSDYLEHHYRQSAILFGAILMLTGLLAIIMVLLSYLLINFREFYVSAHLEVRTLGLLRKLFLAWAVFWSFGLGMALLGGARLMPLVHRLARRDHAVRGASVALLALYCALLVLLPLAIHASALVPVDRQSGDVYMVYEDNGVFPRWIFALAFYPMARATEETYGPGRAVLLKISRETVAEALAGGRLVFVGSHGTSKGLMLRHEWLLPKDLAAVPKNPNLKFVYLTGCDSGEQRDAWVAALSPADVVTYNRLSATLEHAWWLWFTGPAKVRAVYAEEKNAT